MIQLFIDRGIPIPKRAPQTQYPRIIATMKIGDSFLYPAQTKKDIQRIKTAFWQQADRLNFKITSKKELGGVRIWRKS